MIRIDRFANLNRLSENVAGPIKEVARVSTDTRTLKKGDLFFALSGENFDGNKFIRKALEKGASGCVLRFDDTMDIEKLSLEFPTVFFISVENTEKYFQELAKYHYQNWKNSKDKIAIGITGSNGKTTTKELLASLLEYAFPGEVLFTAGNLNNHLGLPMTLLRLVDSHRICILELGTNHPGEIPFLCKMADPDAGIITSIGQSHLEFFETEENVFKEKITLFNYVKKKNGIFSLDGDNAYLKDIVDHGKLNLVGFENGNLKLKLSRTSLDFSGKLNFSIDAPNIFGIHNFKNLALALSLSCSLYPEKEDEMIAACKTIKLPKNNRSELIERNGKAIYLDAYNANPSSMLASLNTFKMYLEENNKKLDDSLFILGDMNELGSKSSKYHEEIGTFLNELKIKNVIFVGKMCDSYLKGYDASATCFKNTDELKRIWSSYQEKYANFFLKGSRTLQLESLVALN